MDHEMDGGKKCYLQLQATLNIIAKSSSNDLIGDNFIKYVKSF